MPSCLENGLGMECRRRPLAHLRRWLHIGHKSDDGICHSPPLRTRRQVSPSAKDCLASASRTDVTDRQTRVNSPRCPAWIRRTSALCGTRCRPGHLEAPPRDSVMPHAASSSPVRRCSRPSYPRRRRRRLVQVAVVVLRLSVDALHWRSLIASIHAVMADVVLRSAHFFSLIALLDVLVIVDVRCSTDVLKVVLVQALVELR